MMLKILRKNYLLLIIFLAALFIRLWGTKPGFPPFHPDENMSYSTAVYMFFNHFKPNRFDYPAGVPLLHTLIYQTIFLPITFLKMFFPHPRVLLTAIKIGERFLDEFRGEIFGSSYIKALFWSRSIAALTGALTIPLVYLTGKKLFNKRVGLFSAFFLTFNYRHVLGSHFGLPDIHNSFFSLLALFASALLLEKNTKARYFLTGVTCGLAFSIKYQVFAFLPFFLVHLIWSWREKSFRYLFRSDFLKALILSFLTFLIINPHFFFNLKEVIKISLRTAARYGAGMNQLRLYPYFYLYHWGIDRLPSLTIIFGLGLMFLFRPLKFLTLFSFIFPFFFVMTYYSDGGSYPRNFVSVMPFLMIFAGFFMDLLYQGFKKLSFLPSSLLITLLLFSLNLSSIKNSLTLSYYYAQPWNLSKLSHWLQEKLPPNIQMRMYPFPIEATSLIGKNAQVLNWSYSAGPHSLREFQEEGTDFAILDTHNFEGITYWWRQWPNSLFWRYDHVPFDYINSSFYGLTVQELLNYTVAEIYKPWQAASEYNYLIFKIPPKPKNIGKRIVFFDFNPQEDQPWSVRSTFDFKSIETEWHGQEGKNNSGTLVIKGGGGETTSRLASPPIPISPGKFYTVRGWLKNSYPQDQKQQGVGEKERDGFLRIDFYKEKSEANLDQLGLAIALSARAPLSGEWVQEEVNLLAPSQAHYLTVSFQRKSTTESFFSSLDDVEIFESDVLPEEKFRELPYIQPTIPQESIYPNSFL